MPDAAASFVRRILADPTDTLSRLVFADWLDESGTEANAAWALYLRLRARAADDRNAIDREVARSEAELVGARVEAGLSVPAAAYAGNVGALLDLLPAANVTVTVDGYTVPRPALGRVTESAAGRWRGLPLTAGGGRVLLGMVVPSDAEAVRELSRLVDGLTVAVKVPGDQLAHLVHRTFTRALALVGTGPADVVVTPTVSGQASADLTTAEAARRAFEGYLVQARAGGAAGFEVVAQAEDYQMHLIVNGRHLRWQRVGAELGQELARLALLLPGDRYGIRATPRATPRPTYFGPGVRVVFVGPA